MGPQGEAVVEATSLAGRLGSAIIDIEVRKLGNSLLYIPVCELADYNSPTSY